MMLSMITRSVVPFACPRSECVLRFRVKEADMRRDIDLETNVVDVGMKRDVGKRDVGMNHE